MVPERPTYDGRCIRRLAKGAAPMRSCFRVVLLVALCATTAHAAENGLLQAGAARVDITPAADAALPMSGYAGRQEGFKGIHDRIYARAIVISDGTRQAAIVAW